MKLLIFLVSLTAFVSAGTVPDEYTQLNPVYGYITRFGIPEGERIRKAEEAYLSGQSSRIKGGNPAAPSQIPYQVGLISDIIGHAGRGVCGGSLISRNVALSAAHCWFDGINHAWRMTVVLGSNFLFTGGIRILTSNVQTHYNWIPWLVRNDVMTIKLPSSVALSASVATIALPSGRDLTEHFAGRQATTSGFGLIDGAETISPNQFLSYVRVNVIANNVCNLGFPTIIQDTHICTSTIGGVGPRQGDSGGPLVLENGGRIILVGITSFGSALSVNLPAVYTRVTSFMDFIHANM